MQIKGIPVGQLATNCYIVTDGESGRCAVIDPGDESSVILDYLEATHLTCDAIFLTHGHHDHWLGLEGVRDETGAPVYIHRNDAYPKSGPAKPMKFPADDDVRYYKEGDVLTVGSLSFTVMETPGHSSGSVCLLCGRALFSGDTLFRESCGRTDFADGDMDAILRSLLRIAALEGDYEVYPGHMEYTTLERERAWNYYIRYAEQTFGKS
ncbi:MAG: MBL fold metallo-hydrolase [Oscillospiraceae bacterium]|nr:MBL fold metallo-hydrolase [Oscillospiraceae bacterium]